MPAPGRSSPHGWDVRGVTGHGPPSPQPGSGPGLSLPRPMVLLLCPFLPTPSSPALGTLPQWLPGLQEASGEQKAARSGGPGHRGQPEPKLTWFQPAGGVRG